MPDDTPSEVTFVYEDSKDKRTITATGAQGGSSPDGASVVANLYVERGSIPHHVTHQINEKGEVDLSEPTDAVTRGEITREVQTTLVMTPEHALQIADWLRGNAEEAMRRRKQNYED